MAEISVPHVGPDRIEEHGTAAVPTSLSYVGPFTVVSSWAEEWKAVNSIEASDHNMIFFKNVTCVE